jgi:exodeoxyribonuclease V alpha subunit
MSHSHPLKEDLLTVLHGQIERVTYTNDENGFTIAKLKVPGRHDLVTVVGNMMAPNPGEVLEMRGTWTNHPRYGEQFRFTSYQSKVPATVAGIQRYLGSGLIKGIGPVMARRIVSRFGEQTLEIIEKDVQRLAEVEGIGSKRIGMIGKAWDEQREIRSVMLFLQSHGVSSGYATKIFKQYGDRSIQVVRENPYRLATEIFGIGFVTADRIAEKLGFLKDAPLRAEAGTLYVLHQLADEGHVFSPYEMLITRCCEMLGMEREGIVQALGTLALDEKIIIEDVNESVTTFQENQKAVYLAKYHLCETSISRRIRSLLTSPKSIRQIDTEKAVKWVQGRLPIRLAREQVAAIRCAAENKVMVITGGPGTGKTTIIQALLKIFARLGVKILLAAPTGRAAKRMSETTGFEARTIHRLLEYSLQKGGFQRNEDKPLDVDFFVVDEASMIDTILMHHLLKAVPSGATMILVGDVNQLPSVGAGSVLKDIIDSGAVPVVTLNEIFRQARESLIVVNAHRINQGTMPAFGPEGHSLEDFFFVDQDDPEETLRVVLEMVSKRIPNKFGLDPVRDIQVLTPMHKGVVGAENLNKALQETLNPGKDTLVRGQSTFRVDDKVMQIRNNYDKEVFNGDIGTIVSIDPELRELVISFDERRVLYDFLDLDEVVLAYAISVHKSQGSEYPAVVIPVTSQHFMLLQRNLMYTAVTRGKQLVVMVGSKKALMMAVQNDKTERRYTRLQERLRG